MQFTGLALSKSHLLGLLILIAWSLTGCGGNPSTLSGEVRLDGERIVGGDEMRAQVVFYPTSEESAPASSMVGTNGKYELSTGSTRGLQPGEYKVSISLGKITWPEGGGMPSIKELAPAKYHKPTTSGLVVKVEPGSNEHDFDLVAE